MVWVRNIRHPEHRIHFPAVENAKRWMQARDAIWEIESDGVDVAGLPDVADLELREHQPHGDDRGDEQQDR